MKLSDIEKEMVAKIRRQEASLVRQRWVALIGAIVVLVVDGLCIHMMAPSLRKPDLSSVLFIACSWPFILFSGAMVGGVIGYVRANWNGKPERLLLLRLIDELQDHES